MVKVEVKEEFSMEEATLDAQEKQLVTLYRELCTADQQEAVSYLEGLAKRELQAIQHKIESIQENLIDSEGLTRREADIAAKAGLIDSAQIWWWTEDWQAGEREAEADIQAGQVVDPMTVDEMRRYFGDA
jgi:hypothetical protein